MCSRTMGWSRSRVASTILIAKGKVEAVVGHAQKTPLRGLRFERLDEAQGTCRHRLGLLLEPAQAISIGRKPCRHSRCHRGSHTGIAARRASGSFRARLRLQLLKPVDYNLDLLRARPVRLGLRIVDCDESAVRTDVMVPWDLWGGVRRRSEEHTSELQSHSEISYAVFCLKKKK